MLLWSTSTSEETESMLEKIIRRPVVPTVFLAGLLFVGLFVTIALRLTISANGCINQQAGHQKAGEIAEQRKKAASLGDRYLQAYYRHEAERQEQYNREAERSCGQQGVPFDLAMRHIEVLQTFVELLATVMFGFCTLASVLVSVTIRDEAEDKRLDRSARGAGLDGTVIEQHASEVDQGVSSNQLPSKQPSTSSAIAEPVRTTGRPADHPVEPTDSGPLAAGSAASKSGLNPVSIAVTLGLASSVVMLGVKLRRRFG